MSDEHPKHLAAETNGDYTAESRSTVMSNQVYDVLKYTAQVFLPAVATLYFALAQIWGLPSANEVVGSITAFDAFLGLVLRLSTKQYNNSDARYDGTLDIADNGDGSGVINLRPKAHPAEFVNKKDVVFKVNNPTS